MKNYYNTSEYNKILDEFNYVFQKSFFIKQESLELVNCLKLLVDYYTHDDDVGGRYISCQKYRVINKNDKTIFETKYVFGSTFYSLINHSNGNWYLFIGQDLDNYTVFDLKNHESYTYVDECIVKKEVYTKWGYWYIKNLLYNAENNLIAFNGQDTLNCGYVTIMDFTEPRKIPYEFKSLHSLIWQKQEGEEQVAMNWNGLNLEVKVIEEETTDILLSEQEIKNYITN